MHVIRTNHTSLSMAEAVQIFGEADVYPVVGGNRSWRATIKRITGIAPTPEQVSAFYNDESKGEPSGKVNRYFMYPQGPLVDAAHRAVNLNR